MSKEQFASKEEYAAAKEAPIKVEEPMVQVEGSIGTQKNDLPF